MTRLDKISVIVALSIGAMVLWPRQDKSLEGALFVGHGVEEFHTIQSAVGAIYAHDAPRTVYITPDTYSETVSAPGRCFAHNDEPAIDADACVRAQ